MNILFGKPKWIDWQEALNKLPYSIYIEKFKDIDTIIECIKTNKINVIVPCTFDQMFFVIDHKEELAKYVQCIACSNNKKVVRMLDDKYYFYNFMNNKKFKEYVPKNYITNCTGSKVTHNKVVFPCIFKLKQTNGGKGSFVIKSNKDLVQTIQEQNYIIQEYIDSPIEYSAHFYVVKGHIKHSIFYMMTNNDKNYIQCGRLLAYDKLQNGICLDIFERIFTKLNYTGFACIDFKLVNDIPKIFEINPRLGGTLVNDTSDFCEMISKAFE